MKCKYESSCGFEICNLDQCVYYTEAVETNFGRIQDMSLEELAAFLANHDIEQNSPRRTDQCPSESLSLHGAPR